ncbi:MAG: type II secretion system minor pseudopilin GspI [Gammaproteobacteria bacterium]
MKGSRVSGFTLLEVLVALAVLALSMGAAIKAVSDYTNNQAYLRDRTIAIWVARNVLVRFQVENEWPDVGERKGTEEMGNREWRWLGVISQTDEAELRRLDVKVFALESEDDELPISVLSGFLVQPN